jgi:uncharacterized protein involved in high-affinity Fe2+ transport
VRERWIGPIVVVLILGGVALILAVNLNPKGWNAPDASTESKLHPAGAGQAATQTQATGQRPVGFREYPIGEEVVKNQIRIAAVWLPMVQLEGMAAPASSGVIHIEADIHATEGNKNGCAKDEFVPYLTVHYTIVPKDEDRTGAEPIKGELMPMIARDGWHYGASIEMPKAGRYKLTYTIQPPTAAGRHSDLVTGVDPWWKPFEVSFDWDYQGPRQG